MALPFSNIDYPFDVTKGQAGVYCAEMFRVEHINMHFSPATNLARIWGLNSIFIRTTERC